MNYSNDGSSLSVRSFLCKYWQRIPFLVIYYCFARFLPNSTFPVFGKCSKKFRALICSHIFEYSGNNINIERNVKFGSGVRIRIGTNSGIGKNSTVCSDIEIGDNVLMGPNCFFLSSNHAFRNKNQTIKSQGYQGRKKTIIGSDVWIGRECLFTPGRFVADGTVIAARTCVCKDFDPYSIIGGNPSRKIGERE